MTQAKTEEGARKEAKTFRGQHHVVSSQNERSKQWRQVFDTAVAYGVVGREVEVFKAVWKQFHAQVCEIRVFRMNECFERSWEVG